MATTKELQAMFDNPDRLKRARENLAYVKKMKEEEYLKGRQGDKYEALSAIGQARAEAKAKADRERHMKLVLGDDWKPSDEGYLARRKILKNMDKRNRALDPKNDPEMLSSIRNKLNINPTNAEVERRLMARNNAREEQAMLSEGEAEGALAGSAAERIRDARRAQYEMSRTPQDYDDHRIKSKQKREDDYKAFTDEASLIARERAMGGEGTIVQGEGSEEALRQALPFQRATEREKVESLRRKHDRGIIGGGESMDFDDPEIAGRSYYGGPHVGTDIDEQLGGESVPLTEEMTGKSLPLTEEMTGKSIPFTDKMKKEIEGESLPPETLEEAQKAIYNVSDEEQKEISKIVAEQKGMGSDDWVDTKEATGKYVRYEGTGLVINMAALQKDIDRNRNMEMLKHIPAANRPAMLVEWGYIDKDDLSVAQKKSAKELKELSLLDLKIAETQGKIEKNKKSMGGKDKLQYTAANKGMQQALKDKDYALAEVYRNELNSIMPTGDTSSFKELIEKGIKKQNIKTPRKVFMAAGLGKDGKEYYKTKANIVAKVNFLRETKGTTAKIFEESFNEQMPDQPKGVTYGRFLQTQGIPSWEDVKAKKKLGNIPAYALKSEEEFYSWALPQIEDKLMLGIYGNVHTQVNDLNMKAFEKVKKEKADDIIRMPQPWELKAEAQGKRERNKKKDSDGGLMNTNKESTAFTGTSEEASELIKQKKAKRVKEEKDAANKKYRTKYKDLVNKNEWERFEEETIPTMSAMSKEELEDTLKVLGDNVKRKSAVGQRTGFDEMTLEYIRTLLKNK